MVVATQEVFARTDAKSEIWDVASGTPAHSLVKQAGSARYGVTITNAPGITGTDDIEIGPFTISRDKQVGVGNAEATAVGEHAVGVALDGTWVFTGIVSSGTTPVPTTTAQGVVVYATSTGALTLDSASGANDRVGVVNYNGSFPKVAGTLPIEVGA